MKKLFAIALALVMVLALAACSGSNNTPDPTEAPKATGVPQATEAPEVTDAPEVTEDPKQSGGLEGYPADPSDWTSEDIIRYFKEAGVFTNEDWIVVQDHPTYYPGFAINECVSYMDMDGLVSIGIFNTDPANGDADVDAFLAGVRETHAFPEDLGSVPMDHMIGDLLFWYSFTADEDVYNAMDAAYNKLVEDLGVTPDF